MRFGLDVARQHVEFDEVVERARFAEELVSTGPGASITSSRYTAKGRTQLVQAGAHQAQDEVDEQQPDRHVENG
jgi:hypothetical protein